MQRSVVVVQSDHRAAAVHTADYADYKAAVGRIYPVDRTVAVVRTVADHIADSVDCIAVVRTAVRMIVADNAVRHHRLHCHIDPVHHNVLRLQSQTSRDSVALSQSRSSPDFVHQVLRLYYERYRASYK